MPVPATTGQLKTKIEEMEVGDYIRCWYSFHGSGALSTSSAGILWGLGDSAASAPTREIPLTGQASSPSNWSYFFYFVKVEKGLLVADRICQHSITWDTLNAGKVIQGRPHSFVEGVSGSTTDLTGIIRSLTGGVAYADAEGNKATSNNGAGNWPTLNEWDKYIMNSDLDGKITHGDDNVWHWKNIKTWTQDSPIISLSASTNRISRGSGGVDFRYFDSSSASSVSCGFRPVFEYQE